MGVYSGAYRRWVERDLTRWREAGWIDEAGHAAIRKDLESRATKIEMRDVFAIIGAALLCLAGAAFVAANWAEIPRPAKLGLFVALMWAAYAVAYAFKRARVEIGAHAAAMVGASLFGATVMLIGQMYHLAGDPTDAVLVWAIGALATGALLRSAPVLMLAALLGVIWSEWRASLMDYAPHWPFLIGWAALAFAFWRARWSGAFHVLAIALGYWVIALGFRLGDGREPLQWLTAAIGLTAMGASFAQARIAAEPVAERALAVRVYGFIVAFSGLFFWQLFDIADEGGFARLAPIAGLTLAFLLGTLWLAAAREHRTLVWWTYAALVLELGALYVLTLGTLLETSAFFLIAGLMTIALAWLAWRLGRRADVEETST